MRGRTWQEPRKNVLARVVGGQRIAGVVILVVITLAVLLLVSLI
jgi:hypothetical protein